MSPLYIVGGIAIMALMTYFIRVIPMVIFRKKIENNRIKSFLYYVPYVTLAVMTFPAIIDAVNNPLAGVIALIVGIVAAYLGSGLFPTALLCCLTVFIAELILPKIMG